MILVVSTKPNVSFCLFQGSATATQYPGAGSAPTTFKAPRPAMTSPATGIASTPYRAAAGWTPQGYAPTQQPYRYTTPIPQQAAYATYTPHTTTSVSFSPVYNASV